MPSTYSLCKRDDNGFKTMQGPCVTYNEAEAWFFAALDCSPQFEIFLIKDLGDIDESVLCTYADPKTKEALIGYRQADAERGISW